MPDDRWQLSTNYTPWYVGWANCDDDAGAILREFYETPAFLPSSPRYNTGGRKDWIFMGTPGFGAPMHLDNVKYPSWQAQVISFLHLDWILNSISNICVQIHGTKSWALKPPPECWWACHKEMTIIMQPGKYYAQKNCNLLSITKNRYTFNGSFLRTAQMMQMPSTGFLGDGSEYTKLLLSLLLWKALFLFKKVGGLTHFLCSTKVRIF